MLLTRIWHEKVKPTEDPPSRLSSEADKKREEFLKWKAEQQKLAKQKQKDVEIEVFESPSKQKMDSKENSPQQTNSSNSSSESAARLSLPSSPTSASSPSSQVRNF